MRVWRCRWKRNQVSFVSSFSIISLLLYIWLLWDTDKRQLAACNLEERLLRFMSPTRPTVLVLSKTSFEFTKTPNISNVTCSGLNECLKKQDVKWRLVAIVKSPPGNFQRRNKIRNSWGSLRFMYEGRLDVVFLMGKERSDESKRLQKEHDLNEDLLQFNNDDAVKNVPVKSLAELQWASANLDDHRFILSTHDNVKLNPIELLNYTKATMHKMRKNKWPEFPLVCPYNQLKTLRVSRNKSSDWYAAVEHFQWLFYPPACTGGTYLISAGVAKLLYTESRNILSVRKGNIYVTGLLRRQIGMPDKMMLEAPENVILDSEVYTTPTNTSRKFNKFWAQTLGLLSKVPQCICNPNDVLNKEDVLGKG